jgi:hypothetical protein
MSVSIKSIKSIKSIVPSFDNAAKAIIAAQRAADKIAVKSGAAIAQAIQQHLDACALFGLPRDLPGVNALGKTIRECQAFLDAVAVGTFEKKTITEYAQGAMRAYFHNVPFAASLKNDPAYKIPAKDGSVKSAGSVSKTTIEAASKTARKLIEQLRLLGQDDAAAGIVDVMLECNPAFTEADVDAPF